MRGVESTREVDCRLSIMGECRQDSFANWSVSGGHTVQIQKYVDFSQETSQCILHTKIQGMVGDLGDGGSCQETTNLKLFHFIEKFWGKHGAMVENDQCVYTHSYMLLILTKNLGCK